MLPSKLSQVQELMDNILCEVKFSKKLEDSRLAYTYARMNNLCGTIYKIFINNTDPEFAQFLYVHECGHILFSHAKNMNLREDRFLRIKIAAAYDKVKDVFDSPQSLFDFFREMIYNMVMDFEVNSKLFTPEDWKYMNSRLQILMKDTSLKGLWPEDFDFPPGLTWNEYLNLILMRPELFVQKLKNYFDNKIIQSDEPQVQPRFTPEDIEKLLKISSDHNNSTFSIPDGNNVVFSRKHTGTVGIDYTEFENLEHLVRLVRKLLYTSKNTNSRRNQLYNYNRRKLNSNVLVPKDVSFFNHEKANLYLLIDVSGSVDSRQVYNLISTFKNFSKDFKNTQIVTWTTQLVDMWKIDEEIPNNYGGGTDLASGILFVQNQFKLKKNDVLFVISDFCDDLFEWKNALSQLHCKKYGINWFPENGTENPGFNKVFKALNEKSI